MLWRGPACEWTRNGAKLIGVGVGPGDPELMTLKAMRALGEADVIAHFAKAGNASHSRAIVARHLRAGVTELPLLLSGDDRAAVLQRRLSRRDPRFLRRRRGRDRRASRSRSHGRRDLRRRSAVLRLLHASAYAAGAAVSDRDRRRRHRHVGLLVGGGNADRPGRRRLHRAAGNAAGRRAGAPACRRRCRRGDEGRPASAEAAPRARAAAVACRAPSMSSAAPWRRRK